MTEKSLYIRFLNTFTLAALPGEGVSLVGAEAALGVALGQRYQRLLHQVAQAVLGVDVVVAGVEIAVVLQGHPPTTRRLEDAQAGAVA